MTDSDRTVRVLCSFDAIDQTVTLMSPNSEKPGIDVHKKSYLFSNDHLLDGVPGTLGLTSSARSAPVTSVVTNTAPPPSVIMRILDRTGKDAQVVGLGDELTLQIELRDASSAFGLFARNLYARSSNGESLFLLDNTGCPTDPVIFPALQLDPKGSRALNAVFKAFRFPSSGIVNFEVQVRFCQDKCEPIKCNPSSASPSGGESYGRRRRRRSPGKESSLRQLLDLRGDENLEEDNETLIGSESVSQEKTFIEMSSTTSSSTETPMTDYSEGVTSTTTEIPSDLETELMSKSPLMEETPAADRFIMNDTSSSGEVSSKSNQSPQQHQHQGRSLDSYQTGFQGNPYSYPQDYMSSSSASLYPPPPSSSSSGNNYYANHPANPYSSSSQYHHQQHPSLFMQPSSPPSSSSSSFMNPYASHVSPSFLPPPHLPSSSSSSWLQQYPSSPFLPATGYHHQGSPSLSPFTPSSHFNNNNNNDSWNRMNPNEALSKFSSSSSSSHDSTSATTTTTPSSRNMFIHSSRPLPSSEKGKFRPPRPLPRPKNPSTTTSGSPVTGTDTLRTTIMVGDGPDKDVSSDGDSIDRSWSPRSSIVKTSCNTGPAILYTAIIVTLLHIGIVLGGYFYYKRFGYSSSSAARIKLFSTPSFSRENIVRESFGGPSFSSNNHNPHSHHNQLLSKDGHHMSRSLRPQSSPPPVPAKPSLGLLTTEAAKRSSGNSVNASVPAASSAHNANVFYGTASNRHHHQHPHHLRNPSSIVMTGNEAGGGRARDRAFTSFYSGSYGSGDP